MKDSASVIVDALTKRGLVGALAIARELRDAIRRQLKDTPPDQLLNEVRRLLRRYEPLLAHTLSDAALASWLAGGQNLARYLPPPSGPTGNMLGLPEPEEPIIHFPIIEKAAESLAGRKLLRAEDYYAQNSEAKQKAFTVTGVYAEDALGKVRDALAEAVEEGHTLVQFRKAVDDALDDSKLGEAHLETIFRTNCASAYSEGQDAVLQHPLVRSEFPFMETVPVLDDRTTELCRIIAKSGIGGTGIFHADDPVWWKYGKAPRHWNCRCATIPLTVEMAAEKGIEYAKKWLDDGEPPYPLPFVEEPNVDLPATWQHDSRG